MINHITTSEAWVAALETGRYDIPAYHEEGFFHCCTEAQMPGVLERYFREAQELVVLRIIEKRIPDLRWEEGTAGEQFPHVYGNLPLQAVEFTDMLIRGRGGDWEVA